MRFWLAVLFVPLLAQAEPVRLRVVAANLTSGNHQTYSPDNGNHSNPEGAGARILKGLRPDLVLIQEFNPTIPARQWVNQTFGPEFSFVREDQEDIPNFIPNGIISRHPIVAWGEWQDDAVPNRDFVWARIRLPQGRDLWAVSVHLYAQKASVRSRQAAELVRRIESLVPAGDLLVLGGDLNTRSADEECLAVLSRLFVKSSPVDQAGDPDTNAGRTRPYDWVLADADLDPLETPVRIGAEEFPEGLVFDSRVFDPLAAVPPVQASDSAAPQMQHMAVVRDFFIP